MIQGIPLSLIVGDRTEALLEMREHLSGFVSQEDPAFSADVDEHLYSVLLGVTYHRWWSHEEKQRCAASLGSIPDLGQEIDQEARACIRSLGSAKVLRSRLPRLLTWNDTLDTLTVHYLRWEGGGRLNTDAAADLVGMADRTLRYRLAKLRTWGLVGAARASAPTSPIL